MSSRPEFRCLFCDELLAEANASREHIFPNALGGHLLTRNATCIKCNSNAGSTIDGHLSKCLGTLASLLDVPRSRGANPTVVLKDESTGSRHVLPLFGKACLADNLEVRKEGNRLIATLNAPTREEALRILNKKGIKNVQDLQSEEHEGSQFSLPLSSLSYKDEEALRAVAKVALCFARHAGVSVHSSSLAVKFIRREDTPIIPVGTPLADAVSIYPLPENPLHHSVCVFKSAGSKRLLAYVSLFHAYEFVVLLDDNSEEVQIHQIHLWNAVSGRTEVAEFKWNVSESQLQEWLVAREYSGERMLQRASPLKHWLHHREAIWVQRAVAKAGDTYFKLFDEGTSHTEAMAAAKVTANAALSKYELTIERLDFSPVKK